MPVVEPESRRVNKNSPIVGVTTLEKLLSTFNVRLEKYFQNQTYNTTDDEIQALFNK